MVVVSNVPQLVDKKRGNYSAVAPCLEPGKFNKWKMHDIMESIISCETAKAIRTDLVHSFEGPFDTKENKTMDMKLEYQTFRAKPFKSLSQTYTSYKTLINELANDGVTLYQTLDPASIDGRFVYKDNLIARRFPETKKALITTPSDLPISTAFFSNNIVQEFRENSDDEADERSSEEYLRDLDLESPMSNSFVSKGFQPKFVPKLIQSSQHAQSSQSEPKVQKDYKSEHKKMKAKLALLEAKVLDEVKETRVQVLMALADDELSVGKNHARNGEWIYIAMKKSMRLRKIPSYLRLNYDHEMVLKSKDWVERLNPDNKLLNFNTGRILVPESQTVNEFLQHTKAHTDTESTKDSGLEPQTPLPPLKILQGASQTLRLSYLNFKNINKLAKQNKVLGLPSLVYSKDKPCSACEKGKHKRASFKTKQNFSIRKCLYLLHMDLFGPISPMSVNHEKYTLVIVDEYSRYTWVYFLKKSQAAEMIMSFMRMVENQNDVKVKQIRTDNGIEFRNSKLKSFYDEKGISKNFSSPYTPEQNGVVERKNITLIEAARTMLNGSILLKNFWTEDHLGKFNAKADDGHFLGYSFNSKALRVFNTQRQQIQETYHVTFDEIIEAIRFINSSIDEIRIDDSSRYPPDEFLQEDDPSRQYQSNSYILFYIIPHGHSLTELTQEKHVHKVITQIDQGTPHNEVVEGIPNQENTEGTQEHSQHASTSSYHVPRDRWSQNQHIELVNIIGDPGKGMLIRSLAAKLITTSANECLFADFLFVFRNKKDEHGITTKTKARLVAQGYSQEEGIDYDETFAPVARMDAIKIFLTFVTYMNFIVFKIDVKSAFLNEKLKEEVYVKQPPGFESSEFPNYVCKLDKALYGLKQFKKLMTKKYEMSMIGELTYFFRLQIKQDDKRISICQEQYNRNLLKKYEISDSFSVKTLMVPPNNLGPDLAGKLVNETLYRGMIGSLMYLTATRHDIYFSIILCARYQSCPKESHLIAVKRIFRYLKGTSSLSLYYLKFLGFDLKGYSDSDYTGCNMDRKSTLAEAEYVTATGCCANILWMKSQLSDYDIHYNREFWCIAISYNPNPPINNSEARPLKEYLIKFSVMNVKKPLILDYKTFVKSNGLDMLKAPMSSAGTTPPLSKLTNKSRQKYVSYPRFVSCGLEVLLGSEYTQDESFGIAPTILKDSEQSHLVSSGHVPDPQDPEINKQLAGTGLPSTQLDEGTCKSQLLPKGKNSYPKDSVGNKQPLLIRDYLPWFLMKVRLKPCRYLKGHVEDKDLEGLKPPADMKLLTTHSLTKNKGKTSSEVELNSKTLQLKTFADVQSLLLSDEEMVDEEMFAARKEIDEDIPSTDEEAQSLPPNTEQPESYHAQETNESDSDSSCPDALKKYDNILPLIERHVVKYLRKVSHVLYGRITKDQWAKHEEAVISYANLMASIEGYYGENFDHRNQTDKLDAIKEDHALNKKVLEAIETYTKNLTNLTELLTLVKIFNFQGLKSLVESLQATTLSQDGHLASWVKGENVTQADSKEPPSHTKGENDDMQTKEDKIGKEQEFKEPTSVVLVSSFRPLESTTSASTVKLTNTLLEIQTPNFGAKIELIGSLRPQPTETPTLEAQPITTIICKLVPASKVVREDPDEPVRVTYMINENMHYLTNDEINAHIKKEIRSRREHSQKVKRVMELNKKRAKQYMWTISNRLKPESITDARIHPNSKPAVLKVFRNNNKRNFQVYSPFKFTDFEVTELVKLGLIIQKKKNTIIKDLMISLGKRYERLKKIHEELGIQSALLAPIHE
ncbi:retrovirus-related pol polyprotein from transposon TNT 1-94 [Tanacetum coccineum]|uniref:Retrovirus-related pol polyprotein from transposon TNT 1-94 n=1 Tax=Tanacetum coccineum TaxID=301880 RepID=A0ABQ5BFP6_9ASTR